MASPHVVVPLVGILGVIAGFVFTRDGLLMWDDGVRMQHSKWLLSAYNLLPERAPKTPYYAPLWELFLGIQSELVFKFLRDPTWVRHAFTFALYPLFFYAVYDALRRIGVSISTTFLALAGLFAYIRFGGHALFNVKDFPGAVFFTLTTLWLWILLKKLRQGSRIHIELLLLIGCVSVLPYLVRSPLLLHFALAIPCTFFCLPKSKKTYSFQQRCLYTCIPFASGLLTIVMFSPYLWTLDLKELITPVEYFARYEHWKGHITMFGHRLHSHNLPWWYTYGWIPVGIHPLAFLLFLWGLVSMFSKKMQFDSMTLRLWKWDVSISFRLWLWSFVVLTWGLVAIKEPVLYDEDRHILFMFPILFLFGFLGLHFLRDRSKYMLSCALIGLTCFSYGTWGRYSYAYKSVLIGDRSADRFLGDYWGLCVGQAVKVLTEKVPSNTYVRVIGPGSSASLQLERLRENTFFADENIGDYAMRGSAPEKGSYAVIAINRDGRDDAVIDDIATGTARLLWSTTMPPGDQACTVALYE